MEYVSAVFIFWNVIVPVVILAASVIATLLFWVCLPGMVYAGLRRNKPDPDLSLIVPGYQKNGP